MGTRGTMGFRADNQDKLTYNHFDSYPSGLGEDVLTFLRSQLEQGYEDLLRNEVRALRLVDRESSPTEADKALAVEAGIVDTGVSTGSMDEWYVLLRGAQGNPAAYLSVGVMIDGHSFLEDSLFCEWAYIINLDSRTLEVYRGFQKKPHNKGRYASLAPENLGDSTYYPVALIKEYSFDELPDSLSEIENE